MSSYFMRATKYREKKGNILENGSILLKELIASCNGKCNLIRSFSAQELKTATNNYEERRAMYYNGYFKFYSGFLQNRPISVMKFDRRAERRRQQSFNSIIFASQMCHNNFLRLIGCCLETRIPILVFESIRHETLGNFICSHLQFHLEPLLLTQRLKIAMEVANALTYLHTEFPRPVVFKGLKPSNIFLDEQNVVKLYDFSLSESIPEGETHIKDYNEVIGTYGYMAPEYVFGRDYNEKYDVYSFGVLMLELLTAQKIYDLLHKMDDHEQYDDKEAYSVRDDPLQHSYEVFPSHGHVVRNYIDKNGVNETVDTVFIRDGTYPEKEQQLLAFAELACKCLSKSPEERPTMIDVAKQLRQMYRSSM